MAYVNGEETNRLVKEYTTQGEILMENFSLSTTSVE
ncbi:beta-barrel fold lipoprotein [Paraprevotella clara]